MSAVIWRSLCICINVFSVVAFKEWCLHQDHLKTWHQTSLFHTEVSGARSFLGEVAIMVWFPEDCLSGSPIGSVYKVLINDDDKVSGWICSCWPRRHEVSFLFPSHLSWKQTVNQNILLLIKDFSGDLGQWEAFAAFISVRETFLAYRSALSIINLLFVSAALWQAVGSTLWNFPAFASLAYPSTLVIWHQWSGSGRHWAFDFQYRQRKPESQVQGRCCLSGACVRTVGFRLSRYSEKDTRWRFPRITIENFFIILLGV